MLGLLRNHGATRRNAFWKRPWSGFAAVIGLDVGEGGLRAVQLAQRGDRYLLSRTVAREWRAHAGSGDADACVDHDERCQRIRDCLRQGMFRGRCAVTALNPPALTFHALELPRAVFEDPATNEDQVVRWELERLISEPIDHVETRHWTLPSAQTPGSTAIGVTVRRDTVEQSLKLCHDAGLVCRRVDTGANALTRMGSLLRDWEADSIWGVLDLGFTETRLVLCVDDVPVLVRRAGTGGQTWTNRIAEALQFSIKAAEVQKRDHGIVSSRRGSSPRSGDTPVTGVGVLLLGALRGEFREVVSEIKRSYEYILSCYPHRRASDLVLVGGGAAMPNLPEFLGGALGIPVRRASDYLGGERDRLILEDGCQPPLESMALAVGLAIPG